MQEADYKVIQLNDAESTMMDSEVVFNKGFIVESTHSQGEFVSSIFLRLKKYGVDYWMILNPKELNKFIVYRHCKMDLLKTVTDLMTQGCYMASVDIKDAYYTVPELPQNINNFLISCGGTNCINIQVCQMGWYQPQESLLNS